MQVFVFALRVQSYDEHKTRRRRGGGMGWGGVVVGACKSMTFNQKRRRIDIIFKKGLTNNHLGQGSSTRSSETYEASAAATWNADLHKCTAVCVCPFSTFPTTTSSKLTSLKKEARRSFFGEKKCSFSDMRQTDDMLVAYRDCRQSLTTNLQATATRVSRWDSFWWL